MKKIVFYTLSIVFFAFFLENSYSQDNINDRQDIQYEKDSGKIFFQKLYNVPNLQRDSLVSLTKLWIENRLKNSELSGRLLYNNDGSVVASFTENLIFKTTFISVDQVEINYIINVVCKDEGVDFKIVKIKYNFDENNKYTAEEIISDKDSIDRNNSIIMTYSDRTKIKTIDLANDIFKNFGDFIPKNNSIKTSSNNTSSYLTQSPNIEAYLDSNKKPIEWNGFVKIDPTDIMDNIITLISKDWMLITAKDGDNVNMMTGSTGGLGYFYKKPTMTCFIKSSRYTASLLDKGASYTISFFSNEYKDALRFCGHNSGRDVDKIKGSGLTLITTPNGSAAFKEAWLIIECKPFVYQNIDKLAIKDEKTKSNLGNEDAYKMYMGLITNVWVKRK